MVQDHQKTSSELKAVVEGSMVKLTLPPTMDSEHQRMLNDLQAKDGKATGPTTKSSSKPIRMRSPYSNFTQKMATIPN